MSHRRLRRTFGVVSASDAPLLLHLPVVYAVALALRDAGLDSDDIARRLDLSVESMPALFEIADAKLSALRRDAVNEFQYRVTDDGPDRP
jgi:hypothetical protein